jgi:hypothetical protein
MPLVIALVGEDRDTEALLATALCADRSTHHWEHVTSMGERHVVGRNLVFTTPSGFHDTRWLPQMPGALFIRVLTGPAFLLRRGDRASPSTALRCAYTITVNRDWMESAAYWLTSELAFAGDLDGSEEAEEAEHHSVPVEEYDFRCWACNVSLGAVNPRQLCGKRYCELDPRGREESQGLP